MVFRSFLVLVADKIFFGTKSSATTPPILEKKKMLK
jgi:hypothetical protein